MIPQRFRCSVWVWRLAGGTFKTHLLGNRRIYCNLLCSLTSFLFSRSPCLLLLALNPFCVHGAPSYTSSGQGLVSFCCRHNILFSFQCLRWEDGAAPGPHSLRLAAGLLSFYPFLCWTDPSTFLLRALMIEAGSFLQPDTLGASCSYQQSTVHCRRDDGSVHVHQDAISFSHDKDTYDPILIIADGIGLPNFTHVLFIIFSFVFYDWLATVVVFIVGNLLIPNWNCESAIYIPMYLLYEEVFRSKIGVYSAIGLSFRYLWGWFFACTT